MGRISFENYGEKAKILHNYTQISGRYTVQEGAEREIIKDVMIKLDLHASDTLLEIGCGAGNLLIPLSFQVSEITGIDHELCIELFRHRFPESKNVNLIPGNFLDIPLNTKYTKILCYSVLHCLENGDEVIKFVDKALELLQPGGIALFGDIPNESQKKRFINSNQGKAFLAQWERLLADSKEVRQVVQKDEKLVRFDDTLVTTILKTFRDKGYSVYILPQPPDLPFGYTREDILIKNL